MKWIGLLLLVLLAASQAASQVPDDKVIVPGVRIGKWTLQMTIDDLLQLNGPASPSHYAGVIGGEDFFYYEWSSLGLAADTYDKKKVELLRVGVGMGSGGYVTDKGIAMGLSKRSDIVKVYGEPTVVLKKGDQSNLIYDKIGVVFRGFFDADQGVRSIFIFRPGSAKSIWKF